MGSVSKDGVMPKSSSVGKFLAITGVAIVLTLFLASSATYAEDDTIGSDEYRISCMSCHGVGGRAEVAAHGERTKPVWDNRNLAKQRGV